MSGPPTVMLGPQKQPTERPTSPPAAWFKTARTTQHIKRLLTEFVLGCYYFSFPLFFVYHVSTTVQHTGVSGIMFSSWTSLERIIHGTETFLVLPWARFYLRNRQPKTKTGPWERRWGSKCSQGECWSEGVETFSIHFQDTLGGGGCKENWKEVEQHNTGATVRTMMKMRGDDVGWNVQLWTRHIGLMVVTYWHVSVIVELPGRPPRSSRGSISQPFPLLLSSSVWMEMPTVAYLAGPGQ